MTSLTPEQEQAVEETAEALKICGGETSRAFVAPRLNTHIAPILRDLVARVTEQAREEQDKVWIAEADRSFEHVRDPYADPDLIAGWKGHGEHGTVALFVLHEIWKRNPRVEPLRQRISTLEGLLREAVACVEIVERRDMGGQEWLDARRLRLRIEAELAEKGERNGE
jgi:hypothetical protein